MHTIDIYMTEHNKITFQLLEFIHARFQLAPVTSTIDNYYREKIIHTYKTCTNFQVNTFFYL